MPTARRFPPPWICRRKRRVFHRPRSQPGRRSLTSIARRSLDGGRRPICSPATRPGASPPTLPSCPSGLLWPCAGHPTAGRRPDRRRRRGMVTQPRGVRLSRECLERRFPPPWSSPARSRGQDGPDPTRDRPCATVAPEPFPELTRRAWSRSEGKMRNLFYLALTFTVVALSISQHGLGGSSTPMMALCSTATNNAGDVRRRRRWRSAMTICDVRLAATLSSRARSPARSWHS